MPLTPITRSVLVNTIKEYERTFCDLGRHSTIGRKRKLSYEYILERILYVLETVVTS